MRDLTDSELELIAGGYDDSEYIYVPGVRPPNYWFPPFPGYPGYTPPPSYGGGGGGGSAPPAVAVANHTQDCSSDDGAAVQVAKHVMGLPTGSGPPDAPLTTASGQNYQTVEFAAIIVNNGNGTFGALNDKIYSNGLPHNATLPSAVGTNAVGIWHNHHTSGSDAQNNIQMYPSLSRSGGGDWVALAELKSQVAPNNPAFDPSLYITGPDGVTREFKLSEREYFEGLSDAQMAQKSGLQDRDRTQSCS